MSCPVRLPVDPGSAALGEPGLQPATLPSGCPATLAVRHADARHVLSDARLSRELAYPGAPTFFPGEDATTQDPDFLANMPPDRHRTVRRLIGTSFTPRRVAAWRPAVERIADDLTGDLLALDRPDFVARFAFPFPMRVICTVIGIPDEDQERFRGWTTASFAAEGAGFLDWVGELVRTRRAHPRSDLVDELIAARDGADALTEAELVRLVLALIVAGHETTAAALSRGLYTLLAVPERWERLVADPDLVPAAVEELLRLNPPVDTSLVRVTTAETDLPSGTVPAQRAVVASLTGANLDPEVFDDPTEFSLDRPAAGPRGHLTFGHGPHFCLGANVARLELDVALRTLLRRAPGLRLAVDPARVEDTTDLMVRTLTELPVTW
jgi:cytochrome P450